MSKLKQFVDARIILIFSLLGLIWLFSPDNRVLIYVLSYVFHFINIHTLLFRSIDSQTALRESLLFRSLALILLAYLMFPYLETAVNLWAVPIIAVGFVLHSAAVFSLGMRRTYFAVELGELPAEKIERFPYGFLPHPMAIGASLEFLGLYFLFPEFNEAYPMLILGHVILTILTAVVEHFNWHFAGKFFTATFGTVTKEETRAAIDSLRDYSLQQFRADLHQECSMHRYIKTLSQEAIELTDRIRFADEVLDPIHQAFPQSTIVPLPMTDEFYISRYNYDRGGDQGLFDKHYDGNLRFWQAGTVVRSLLYLSSDDHLEVEFATSGKRKNFKTYEFGLLDFHKELHWVNGSYEPENPPRVLLKCNYYVDHTRFAPLRWLGIGMNVAVFYVVKAAMEYSKSPKTLPQKLMGGVCNLVRRLNILNPALPVALVVVLIALSTKLLLWQFSGP